VPTVIILLSVAECKASASAEVLAGTRLLGFRERALLLLLLLLLLSTLC
jgi:hypothetical protein